MKVHIVTHVVPYEFTNIEGVYAEDCKKEAERHAAVISKAARFIEHGEVETREVQRSFKGLER